MRAAILAFGCAAAAIGAAGLLLILGGIWFNKRDARKWSTGFDAYLTPEDRRRALECYGPENFAGRVLPKKSTEGDA